MSNIKPEWEEYYQYLEHLRVIGVTNMFGAVPYLMEDFNMGKALATSILSNWMDNYSELAEKYKWR